MCYGLNVCVSSRFIYKILILPSKMLVLRDGAFQRCLSHESRTFMNGINAFIKEALETSLASLTAWAYNKKISAMKQKEGLHENETSPATWSWTLELLEINFCIFVKYLSSVQFNSVAQSCLTLCDTMDCSLPGFPVHHQHLEFTQTHVYWDGDATQSSYLLSSPSPPTLSLSQHQSHFKWVSSSHQVAKVMEFQLQNHSF